MKNLIKSITVLIFLLTSSAYSQGDILFTASQDGRLFLIGDDKGNEAFTPNILANVQLQGNQAKNGFSVVGLEYEYANLKGGNYNRYALIFGYSFNNLFVKDFEITVLGSYSGIIRTVERKVFFDFEKPRKINSVHTGFGAEVSLVYNIPNTNFKVIATNLLLQRTDKESLYGNDASYTFDSLGVDHSFFIGLGYQINLKY